MFSCEVHSLTHSLRHLHVYLFKAHRRYRDKIKQILEKCTTKNNLILTRTADEEDNDDDNEENGDNNDNDNTRTATFTVIVIYIQCWVMFTSILCDYYFLESSLTWPFYLSISFWFIQCKCSGTWSIQRSSKWFYWKYLIISGKIFKAYG